MGIDKNQRKQRGKLKEEVVFPLPETVQNLPGGYSEFITQIKQRISQERIKTILSANAVMVMFYWEIGNSILQRQQNEGWGAKVIDRMSYDLKNAFPDMQGFSPRNLKYMRTFAEAWPDIAIVQRIVAQIPWRSNITLLDKLKDAETRLWYAQKTIENGFGKDMLVFQIESQLHKRQGAAVNIFNAVLPPNNSDLTAQIFKDPYIFDFLGTADPRKEAEQEQKLLDHIQKFLLELGQGFAFVGRQVHLELGGKDFYLDLLFYHLKLRCYVVVESRAGEFEPGSVSKLNMYQNVVNDVLMHADDQPSIGLLLVKSANKLVVEYSLAGYANPIGIANWENDIENALPNNLKASLPSISEIEKELEKKQTGKSYNL
ncbi:MAG: PDDEXK nuclease domain-containing protein [Flavobacterium sp.]|uniref:PDDEXK nuclease domain-containing protein n=1 Tax=Flavobacterium sp. TaxID=239 RepID=UPI003267E9A5